MAAEVEVSRGLDPRLDALLEPRASRMPVRALFETISALPQPVIDHDWQALAKNAGHCLGTGYAAFRQLQGEAIQASRLEARQARTTDIFAGLLATVAKSDRRDAFAESLGETLAKSDPRARLEALLAKRPPLSPETLAKVHAAVTTQPGERLDIDDSLDKLARGKTKGVSLLEPYSPKPGDALAKTLEPRASFVLACLCRGLLAEVHAQFNLTLAALPEREFKADLHEAIKHRIAVFADDLEQGQRDLYAALVTRFSQDGIADAALALAGSIERRLPAFVGLQALLRQLTLQLREQGKNTTAERFGSLAVDAGALTREAIASHCAAYRLALAVLGPQPTEDIAMFVKRTDALPFASDLPDGKNTELKALDASLEDAFVEIEGVVAAVEASRQADGKLIGHLVLLDPSSGARADAVAVFAHLPHAGITRDAFCRLSGVFHAESALLPGRPVVEIDALSLAELARSSWKIAFLRLAERWFQPWRNGANLAWSLGPHGNEQGLFGAGELLFTPLIRR
ncbi:hypothetical protein SAMN02745148_01037 [Modicisalibacter ilicicola DSM 19980]|uniref:Uncharacterized protein n=1 Tax=Modicisalibacter ilicicola DSM 19980 TaxID=1121942 RepID=A0A1M4W117_9GAMM|nr:hypothetical protein [Halomonas ilicicola]SHE74951.1 hypothetical protein SAMN02745148_01037 [Halomonas ilicicola DSM 19980]